MFRKIISIAALLTVSSLTLSACGENSSSNEKSSIPVTVSETETVVPDESTEESFLVPPSFGLVSSSFSGSTSPFLKTFKT